MGRLGRRPQPRIGNPNSLTAAGSRIRKGDGDTMRRLDQPWQAQAFEYYDRLGEIKYAAQFYSRALSNLKLFSAVVDDDGDLVEDKNVDAQDALARIQDPGGGRSGLLAAYGRLMFLAGEALLFVTHDDDTGMEQWEMLSTAELRVQDGSSYLRYRAPSMLAEGYREPNDDDWQPIGDKEAVAYRLWQRHPLYSSLADSTMQGVLDLCEELVILTQAVRARARSRLAGPGVLFLADEFTVKPLEVVPDEDMDEDVFMVDLRNAMQTAIKDEGAASAVVPLIVRGPIEAIDKGVKHLQIIDPTQLYPETGLRYECIKRIAIGLDMPPEILLGIMDANHWTGWMIDEQSWKAHLQPKAQQLVDDLTSSYYRPMLRELGVADWAIRSIGYDASAIINHPDRTKDAKDLYGARAIGKKAYREAAGFAEEDAPDKAELAEMIGIAVRDGGLAWFGTPTIRGGNIETAPGVVEGAGPADGQPEDQGVDQTGADVETGPPASGSEDTSDSAVTGSVDEATSRILGAADFALLRAREVAGNRLKGLAKRDPEILSLLEGVKSSQVAYILGTERAAQLGAPPPHELVSGARDLVVDALRLWDINGDTAERIADRIEQWAARTLYAATPGNLPPSFENYVDGVRPLTPA